MGLHVSVLGGGKYDTYTITNVEGPFEPSENAPAAKLLPNSGGTAKIVPDWVEEAEGAGPMFDGHFAYTSDSRFGKAVRKLIMADHVAIAVHDRVESWEAYDILSR